MSRTITRGMSLQQPWARLVAEGVFPLIVRSFPTKIRGRVAVLARGSDKLALIDGRLPDEREFPQAAIVGLVEIVRCEPVSLKDLFSELEKAGGKGFVRFYPKHHLPKRSPAYIWYLSNPQLLKKPIKIRSSRARNWVLLREQLVDSVCDSSGREFRHAR